MVLPCKSFFLRMRILIRFFLPSSSFINPCPTTPSLWALLEAQDEIFLWRQCRFLDAETQFIVHVAQNVLTNVHLWNKSRPTDTKTQIWVAGLSTCILPWRSPASGQATGQDNLSSLPNTQMIKYSFSHQTIHSAPIPFLCVCHSTFWLLKFAARAINCYVCGGHGCRGLKIIQ